MLRDIFDWNAEVESINWNAEVAIVFWNAEVDIVNWNADVVDIANRKAEGLTKMQRWTSLTEMQR